MSGFGRRSFIKGCCTAAVAAMAPRMLYGSSPGDTDVLIHVFLRGGLDGLNLVVPISGQDRVHYEAARPSLAIAATGPYGALPLTLRNGTGTGFGLHPAATALRDIWLDRGLAIVHAAGMPSIESRSHFDTQAYIDLGTPGVRGTDSGWMTRAWRNSSARGAVREVPLLGIANGLPTSLLSATDAITMASPTDFQLNAGAWQWQRVRSGSPPGLIGLNELAPRLWPGTSTLARAGQNAHRALQTVEAIGYGALPGEWPTTSFARQLWSVARTVRADAGLRYAAVDLGGWDTHEGQGTAGSGYHYYQNKISELSSALGALYGFLRSDGRLADVTIVVQSEFGRRVRQNASGGTDHGYGNPMLVIGGGVRGQAFYGSWPGLDPEVLSPYFGDLPVTVDYRRVMSEILIRRMGSTRTSANFPGYSGYSPLGVVNPRS